MAAKAAIPAFFSRILGFMRKWKKKAALVFLSATVLSGLCALFYAYYFLDAPPPQDDDLQPSRLAVPEADNGFSLLNIDRQTVVWPSLEARDMDNDEPWDDQVAADVLLKNKALLDSYDASFERKAFQVPELHSLLDSQPYLGGWRELLDLLRIRALSFQRNGEEENAIAEALKLFCFGQKIEDSGGGFSTHSLGFGLKDKAFKLLQGFPRRTKLSSQKIAPYLREIARHNSHAKGLTETLKIEHRFTQTGSTRWPEARKRLASFGSNWNPAASSGCGGQAFSSSRTRPRSSSALPLEC